MAIVLKSNSVEELREEIAKYLDYTMDRERNTASTERTKTDGRMRTARANLAQSLAMELREAHLERNDEVSDAINPAQEKEITEWFWNILPHDREDLPDRRQTGQGTKTKLGLLRVMERIVKAH